MSVRKKLLVVFVLAAFLLVGFGSGVQAGMKEAEKWIDGEFKKSAISRDAQLEEMQWFINAAKPYVGQQFNVVSENIVTHEYESKVLTQAFEEITGIKIKQDLIGEGDVIEKLQTQMQTGRNVYDMYINDSDLIGTHYRYGQVVALSDFMEGEGKDVTLPTLDVDDFIGKSFTTGPDGKLYQLPDQQFSNLYWFRADWFARPDLKKKFKEIYGYELGVPVNWSAYEDIANFFTNDVKEIDGVRVYGHLDYGKKHPSLGWRFTDAWLSMAGVGDKGIPNGLPVDEWGIRVEECQPVGSMVERGGAANSPAAIYALTKYRDWFKFAPPAAKGMDFSEIGPINAQGQIAQQIFWYTVHTATMLDPKSAVVNDDGTPKWRMAPSPHGPYWEKGMKLGYQDAGSWTMLKSTPLERRKAAWLFAQFVTSKTVAVQKFLTSLTPIRESTLQSEHVIKEAYRYGGLIEYYRSPARVAWTPTGTNVPDYPKLAQLWWKNVSTAMTDEQTPTGAMNNLAKEMDAIMGRLERVGMERCSPKLNPLKDQSYWLNQPGSPKAKLANEKPQGETVAYEDLLQAWKEGRAQ